MNHYFHWFPVEEGSLSSASGVQFVHHWQRDDAHLHSAVDAQSDRNAHVRVARKIDKFMAPRKRKHRNTETDLCTKFIVPSMGSMIQVGILEKVGTTPLPAEIDSSPMNS